jgi:hypothetical protein
MTRADPNIFPAVLGVGGVVFTVIANMVFTLIYQRIDFKNKRFFETHSRRLAVYEDVIKELAFMMEKQNLGTIHRLSAVAMSQIIIESLHTLNVLISRLWLYGSPGSVEPVRSLYKQMFPLQSLALDVPDQAVGHTEISEVFVGYMSCVDDALGSFRDLVSAETGKNLVDKKITKIAKKIIDGAKRLKR